MLSRWLYDQFNSAPSFPPQGNYFKQTVITFTHYQTKINLAFFFLFDIFTSDPSDQNYPSKLTEIGGKRDVSL